MVISSRAGKRPRGILHACRRCVLSLTLIIVLRVGHATPVAAQSRFPVNLSMGTHSLTVPWHLDPVTNRFNPVFVVGTDRTVKTSGRVRWYGTANLGFFQHYWWMTGVFLSTEFGFGYALPIGFHTDLRLGVGYLHYFWRRETLVLKDGEYVQATDWGRPSVMVPLSVILGYRGNPDYPLPVAPFVSLQWAVQAPFTDEAPAMTHFFLALGVRIDLGQKIPADER